MKMVRLVYVSTMSPSSTAADRRNILEQAQAHNESHGLTGILCWKNDYFVQWIEGSSAEVNALYSEIIKDKRHYAVHLLDYREVAGREFEEWSMAYIASDDLTDDVLFKYCPERNFIPYDMNSGSICRMLVDIAAVKRDIIRHVMDD